MNINFYIEGDSHEEKAREKEGESTIQSEPSVLWL